VKPFETPETKTALKPLLGKKEYRKPRLTTFGNVSKITHSTGLSPVADGVTGSMSRMPA